MKQKFDLLLAEKGKSDGSMEVCAPFDLSVIAEVETGGAEAVESALQTADSVFRDRTKWLSKPERIEILHKTAALVESRAEELAVEAAREGGKPLLDSKAEVARAIDGIKNCIEVLRTEAGSEIPMGLNAASMNRLALTRKEPIGVVVAVSAFNHPLNLIVHQVCPAVAVGCPVVVKPAGDTPLSCLRLVSILHEAGLPKEWCQAMPIRDRSAATALVADPRVAFFSFIGSGAVGWSLRSKLAPGTRCALEHGGVAPVVVAEDADLKDILPRLAKGAFYHAGQVCVSVQRVYVARGIARAFAEQLAEIAGTLKVGDPTLESTDVGPLIRPAEVDRVEEWVEAAKEEGTEVLCGGKRLGKTTYEPTVLFDPSDAAKVSQEEVFGPVACVYPVDSIDEAIDRANSLPFSFQAAVCTKALDTALYVQERINAATVMVNDHTAFRVDWMPFAGLKHSGYGVGGIPHTMHDMQTEKLLVIRSEALS